MASATPTMVISMKQAQAVAFELGVTLPRKDNGWRKVGNVRLCRLPEKMRKGKKNAKAYRLTAPTVKELDKFYAIANENGRSVCIVYKTENEE